MNKISNNTGWREEMDEVIDAHLNVEAYPKELIAEKCDLNFPFSTYHKGQREAIVETVDAFLNGGVHNVILEAPTGIGKSAIATTVHMIMRDFDYTHRTTITTATKGLQDQYQDLPLKHNVELYDLRGKTNYICKFGNQHYMSKDCNLALSNKFCNGIKSGCEYLKVRKNWADKAPLRITNNAMFIESGEFITINECASDLVVVDECHKIDSDIIERCTLNLSTKIKSRLKKFDYVKELIGSFIIGFMGEELGRIIVLDQEKIDILGDIHTRISMMISDIQEEIGVGPCAYKKIKVSPELFDKRMDELKDLAHLADKVNLVEECKVKTFLLQEWDSTHIQLKPVFPADVAYHGLFRKGTYFLHMSATICGLDSYAHLLGMSPGDYTKIEIDNPIPVEQRTVNYIPIEYMTGSLDKIKILKMVDAIDDILAHHPNDRGIIHSVSYKLAEKIFYESRQKSRMVVSGKRDEILALMKTRKNVVIVSPCIEEGYDFKDDLSRFQILPKVPWGYLGDPLIHYMSDRYPASYARSAILRIVQSCGRSIRGVDDWAITYLLDGSFSRLVGNNKETFPTWFYESILMQD